MTDAQSRTARRFRKPSPLLRWAVKEGKLPPPSRAIVVGAGLLLEARFLADLGWKVDALETESSIKRRPALYKEFAKRHDCDVIQLRDLGVKYRLAVFTHVLEFVESPEDRLGLLRNIARRLSREGVLLLSLRGWSDVRAAKSATARGDGIVTGLGTWTRGFSVAEAKELAADAGLEIADNPKPRSQTPEQVRLICRAKRKTAN